MSSDRFVQCWAGAAASVLCTTTIDEGLGEDDTTTDYKSVGPDVFYRH